MKGNFCRIILGLAALGGISCTTLGLDPPKALGEPTALGQPEENRDPHFEQLETPIAVLNGGVRGVFVATGRFLRVLDAAGFGSGSGGASFGDVGGSVGGGGGDCGGG